MEDLSAFFSQSPASPAARSRFANQGYAAALGGRPIRFARFCSWSVCATIANCDDYEETVDWGDANLAFLRGFSRSTHGSACVDWLRSVMNRLDPVLFRACFSSWVAACRPDKLGLVAINGKTSRRSHSRKTDQKALHVVLHPDKTHFIDFRLVVAPCPVAGRPLLRLLRRTLF
jgi:hypothetical protein